MHKESILYCKDPSLTIQSFLDMSLVENILAQYQNTGLWGNNLKDSIPTIEDSSILDDFSMLQQAKLKSQASFDKLPEALKARLGYEPQALIDYLGDPANTEEAIKFGLVLKVPPKDKAVPVPPAAQPNESNEAGGPI